MISICPRIWALPGVGRVLISKGGVSMRFRRRPQSVLAVRMFWWHDPKKCPSFVKQNEWGDDGLYPILAPRVYDIFRERRVWRSLQKGVVRQNSGRVSMTVNRECC